MLVRRYRRRHQVLTNEPGVRTSADSGRKMVERTNIVSGGRPALFRISAYYHDSAAR